jgi:hypothetical protein
MVWPTGVVSQDNRKTKLAQGVTMAIYAAILILSATGSAGRQVIVAPGIEQIVLQIGAGAALDLTRESDAEALLEKIRGRLMSGGFSPPTLAIDGCQVDGLAAWKSAAKRVAGYALDREQDGSIEIRNAGQVRGMYVRRCYRIVDGRVTVTLDTAVVEYSNGKRIPVAVRIVIDAHETAEGTVLTGRAYGDADLSAFRCRLVRRIASRVASGQVSAGLADTLRTIDRRGHAWYAAGDLLALESELLKAVKQGVLRRLR